MARKLVVVPAQCAVTQQELETAVGLRNQILTLSKAYDQHTEEILNRILAGAPVEPGIHTAELLEQSRGTARITRVRIR